MSEPVQILEAKSAAGRALLIGIVLITILMAWFGIRWQIGNMLAELTKPNDPAARDVARAARGLAPSDPLTVWLAASAEKNVFTPESMDASMLMFREIVRLSPNDYRWWIELGRASEQAESFPEAEAAFRRAIELSPSYAYPRWQLGNFLLRQGRADEAFAELRRTTENNQTYREQVFSLAWDYFDHDPTKVEALAVDTPEVRVNLALFYAARGQASDSLRIWNTLTDEQKTSNPQTARLIAQALTEKKFYRQGLEFSRQVGIDPEAQIEAITNGGFERSLPNSAETYYGWKIERGERQLEISTDSSAKHNGNRALRLTFRTYVKPQLANVWQVVAVQPGAAYTLGFWIRTENLRSGGPPMIEVLNAADNRLITASPAFPTGSNEWQHITIDFTAPEDSDGVVIRTARAYCGDACPIVGLLWYDDFELVKR